MQIKESELILNTDGSVYHLKLHPNEVAKNIITVGDPERVKDVSKYFDTIEVRKKSREFHSITGRIGKKRITVISTGIGTDNIDIVFNEIDALFNIDLKKRVIKTKQTSLNFYRIGTSGSIHKEVPVDSFVVSTGALGLDGLMAYYNYKENRWERNMKKSFNHKYPWIQKYPMYLTQGSELLLKKFDPSQFTRGITITANGFYGPQGRILRLKSNFVEKLKRLHNQKIDDQFISNLEMETAGIYGLANLLGHESISLNAILANRATGHFSSQPKKTVKNLIEETIKLI